MNAMKLSRNRSSIYQEYSQEKASDGDCRLSIGLFRVILHSLLCVAALVFGFRLSGEARLVVVSVKPSHGTFFSQSMTRLYKVRNLTYLSVGVPYLRDDRRDFTPTMPSGLPPSTELKSSTVHVGRHEILVRSWPHPDPLQTMVAHRLIELVKREQQRFYGLQERKQLLVITTTFVGALQTVHLSSISHTLRLISGPLTWIVVEAGGISNETAELLSTCQLIYHHFGIQQHIYRDWVSRKHMEQLLRFEGLRFVRESRLDGIVVFLDESITYSLELFDVVQKVDWIGAFSVGLLELSESIKITSERSDDSSGISIRSSHELEMDHMSAAEDLVSHTVHKRSSVVKEDSASQPLPPLQGPVCNSEGHLVGWYVPFKHGLDQNGSITRSLEWVGFALNARIFWEDYPKPTWIKSWNELFGINNSLPENPLALLKDDFIVEPLGNCGREVMVWLLQSKAYAINAFPPRWIINPPLNIVVPSKRTPWLEKLSAESASLAQPPPVSFDSSPQETIDQNVKGRAKRAQSGRRKHRSHHRKPDQGKGISVLMEQFLSDQALVKTKHW